MRMAKPRSMHRVPAWLAHISLSASTLLTSTTAEDATNGKRCPSEEAAAPDYHAKPMAKKARPCTRKLGLQAPALTGTVIDDRDVIARGAADPSGGDQDDMSIKDEVG